MAQARDRSSPGGTTSPTPHRRTLSPRAPTSDTTTGRAYVSALVEHAALRSERRVGQDHQAAAPEEVRYLLLADEPVDQLDAPGGRRRARSRTCSK